jgi:hypothetical protein
MVSELQMAETARNHYLAETPPSHKRGQKQKERGACRYIVLGRAKPLVLAHFVCWANELKP